MFNLFTNGQVKSKKLEIRDNKFKLNIVKLYSSKIDNKIHYCANTREVTNDKLSIEIPELDNFLIDGDGKEFSIAIYVEGEYLDQNVDEERTTLTFAKGEIEFPDQTTQEELRKAITNLLNTEFSEQINALSQTRFTKVKEFVNNHPRYRQLLKYKSNEVKKIPSTLSEEKMELELF